MKYYLSVSICGLLLISCSQKEVIPVVVEKTPVVTQVDIKKEEKKPEKKDIAHWSYEGAFGPQFWGSLDPKNSVCGTGLEQSPIDLIWRKPKKKGSVLTVDYKESKIMPQDSGHSIGFMIDPQSRFTHNGDSFDLMNLHFHSPSEHTLSGKSFPLELHFIHKSMDGKLAVIGVLFEESTENKTLGMLWDKIPARNSAVKQEAMTTKVGTFNPRDLLPKTLTHYNYRGSLTTPPCTEGVDWILLNTPVSASKAQIEALRAYYKGNNRPVQNLNTRTYHNY